MTRAIERGMAAIVRISSLLPECGWEYSSLQGSDVACGRHDGATRRSRKSAVAEKRCSLAFPSHRPGHSFVRRLADAAAPLKQEDEPISTGHDFDALDQAILALLQRDGRVHNRELAHRVGLSESACLQRVKRLEQSGVIKNVRAHLDHRAIGATFEAWGLLQIADNNSGTLHRLREALARASCVLEAHELAGPFDVLVRVVARDASTWRKVVADLEAAGLISGARTAIIQSELKPLSPVFIE